jgi:NTE family protein
MAGAADSAASSVTLPKPQTVPARVPQPKARKRSKVAKGIRTVSDDGVRRGLVLGGGGVLGAAWIVGALCALEEVQGIDLRQCEHIVGTSAGSVIAALLGAGVSPAQLRSHQLGEEIHEGPLAGIEWDYDHVTGSNRPGIPRFGPGSARLLTRNVSRLRQMPATAVLSALLPEGRGSLARIGHLVEAVTPADGWCEHKGVWVVAMDYESGRRVPFGRADSPPAPLADAVRASCAIPGWFSPAQIGGRRYIDGGACSATNADLLADLGLDEVYIVAPMVSFALDHPQSMLTRLERRWRIPVTRRCLAEAHKIHASGSEVTILGPGPEDLETIGGNLMETSRRRATLLTSLRTSKEALLDPEHAEEIEHRVDAAEASLADVG